MKEKRKLMLINQLDDEIIKNLSQSELYILHYVYDHPDEVIDMSIQELAKAVAFSSATILRFCKSNFSGFAEFKFALKQQNRNCEFKETNFFNGFYY